jgi:hypothetical protein
MKTSFRLYFAAFLAALGFSLPASATTFSIDYSDLWYVPTEAGWGLNIIHQGDTLFASLFVFGSDGTPRWYYASGMTGSATSFSGALSRATGTNFAAPWNPAAASSTTVGTMSINFATQSTGTLTYTVDGAPVTKSIQRFAFKNNDLSGNYVGGMVGLSNNCQLAANNNRPVDVTGFMTVLHSGNPRFVVEFLANGVAATCVFTGAYAQEGKLGNIPNGTWSCTGGATNAGTFSMQQIDAKLGGMTAVITAQDQFCRYVGYFGGVSDVQ